MQPSHYEIGVEAMKFWFWFLWAIDAVIAAVVLYFFLSLAGHGRIASFNILPWLIILAILAAVVGGSVWLRSTGQRALAIALLLLLAIPGTLYVLFCFHRREGWKKSRLLIKQNRLKARITGCNSTRAARFS